MADPMKTRSDSLCRLSDAEYDVAPGEHDVRGWDVVLGNDEKIGKVDDLIIDPSAGKVRYLDVDLDRSISGSDRHVMVPINSAQLDADDKDVVLSGMSRAALLELPDYDGDARGSGYDEHFRSHLKDDFATKRVTRSAEELRIGKRMEKTGEVRVGKHVETEHVRQNVPVQREEVHIERRPVERAVGSAEFRDDEIVVPVMEEEAVVEKRPVVKEEIVISKEKVTEQRPVEAEVRHEEFDVKPSSGDVRVKGDLNRRGGE